MIRTLILTAFCLAAAAILAVQSSHAATKAGVETQFRQWLEADLWPEAKRAGVSKPVFDRAFSGVSLDWDLPDLAPPGFPKPKQRAQSQAEFREPGAYFSE
ncbi:MAG: lytic murein transglycosylase, partial [Hoeflea sp.]|nr:lytic murein transglycosylase [Hoeflea sp.]